jgi:murein tripeptide amidase MpaA
MLVVKLIAVFLALASATDDSLAGEKVYRIVPTTEGQVHFLKKWIDSEHEKVDVWKEPSMVGHNVDVRVPADLTAQLEATLGQKGQKFEVMIPDVEFAIQEQEESNKPNAFSWLQFDYNRYNTYSDIVSELRNLARTYANAETFNVGKTFEKRDMIGLKIGSGGKPVVWIDGGIHAREWISPATVMYFLNKLLTSQDQAVTDLLAKYDFYFLPVFNADGYVYTHTGGRRARFWRKTRSRTGTRYIGVDPNRNWDYKFGGAGTSGWPGSDIYRGSRAFSEIEVKQVADYLKTLNLKAYFNVHAYSQLVLTPWSYKKAYPSDYDEIARVARAFTDALYKRYGTYYEYGPPSQILYAVAGGSIDWTYAVLGVRYSYALELRDKGRYGFLLPASQIQPSGEETSDAFIAAISAMK